MSFVDLISNLLGVFIIITLLFVLLRLSYATQAETVETLPVTPKATEFFRLWDNYYLVVEDRIILIDINKIAQHYAENGSHYFHNAQGKIQIDNFETNEKFGARRDPGSYAFTFTPDIQKLITENKPLEDYQGFINNLANNYQKYQILPTFMVLESGMEVFSDIYPQLMQAGIRHRWYPMQKNTYSNEYNIIIRHLAVDFNKRDVKP